MPVIMKYHGSASGNMHGAGEYLKSMDFEAHNGRGDLDLTAKRDDALRFENMETAFTFYRASPTCKPWREDGKPNRPLTAGNWEFETV